MTKRVFAVTFVCALVCACGQHPHSTSELSEIDSTETEEAIGTIANEAEADTLLLDSEPGLSEESESVDETLNDFLFAFDQSHRVQRNRTVFPLPIEDADGTLHYIERKDWHHHFLFLKQDYFTVLYNHPSQLNASDTVANQTGHVSLEQIFLHNRIVATYYFDRDSLGRWMLTHERNTTLDAFELGQFVDFYAHFATDSVFQRHHVKDPLRLTTTEDDETVEGFISADQWYEFAPELPQDVLTNIRYGQTYNNPNRVLLLMSSFGGDLQTRMTFQRDTQNGEWRLTRMDN